MFLLFAQLQFLNLVALLSNNNTIILWSDSKSDDYIVCFFYVDVQNGGNFYLLYNTNWRVLKIQPNYVPVESYVCGAHVKYDPE